MFKKILFRLWIALTATVVISVWPSTPWAQQTPESLDKQMEQSIRDSQANRKRMEVEDEAIQNLLDGIRENKAMDRWLDHGLKKYEIYIRKQEETIAELERRKAETDRIKMTLEPFLEALYTRLEAFVSNDLPFLEDERKNRLLYLRNSLDDYHLGLAEKTRRTLEALQVEAGYGATVEKTEQTIRLNGNTMQVSMFRLGRTALYFLSLDGKTAGWFDPATKQWAELPNRYGREIQRALEIAEKKRTPELLNLPVGGPES